MNFRKQEKQKAFYNKFLLYNCVCAPEKASLYFVSRVRQRVKATAPGIRFFRRLKRFFPNIKITTRDGKNEPETNRITLAEPTAEYFIDAVKSGREPLLWSAYYAYLIENNPERAERIKSFFSATHRPRLKFQKNAY
ncbi:MAG: hypothetical protein L6V93_07525 [Clostridiales bacterium]|nr:MAG: hypothetical protein L6V93_07525 [Clostridiales bacterium]